MNQKKTLHNDILISTGIDSSHCYQCGKCSASCPISTEMDFTSNVLMRMIQIEAEQVDKKLLCSQAIWLCISCEMCFARCPMEINIPKVIDYLRQRSLKEHLQNRKSNKNIIAFHRIFLKSIKYTGRLYEVGLIIGYKLVTFHWLQDLDIALYIFLKKKLPLIPKSIKKKQILQTIFKKFKR